MNSQTPASPKATKQLLPLLCFAILGGLSAGKDDDLFNSAIMFLAGLFLGAILLIFLGWLLSLFSPHIKQAHGRKSIRWIINRGFLLLIPFTILALIATTGLGWQAATTFASAGIMTSSTAVGVELARLGGGKVRSSLLPMLGGIVMSTVWMLLLSVVATIL